MGQKFIADAFCLVKFKVRKEYLNVLAVFSERIYTGSCNKLKYTRLAFKSLEPSHSV